MNTSPHHRPVSPWLLLGGSLFCNAAAQHFFAAALREGCTPALAAWLNSAVAAVAIFIWLRWRNRRPGKAAPVSCHSVFVRHRRLLVLTAVWANSTRAPLVLAGLAAGETNSPGRLGLALVGRRRREPRMGQLLHAA